MAKEYDLVILTHLPAFYKVNLYRQMARRMKLCVIFVGKSSSQRTKDFVDLRANFDHIYLHSGDFESRSKIKCTLKCIHLVQRLKFKKILVGGWDLVESWAVLGCCARAQLLLALESGIFESRHKGFKALLKRVFLKKISLALACATPHLELLQALGFKGKTLQTQGVGIFHFGKKVAPTQRFSHRFLFVGRLSWEKNIPFLVECFRTFPEYTLSIVGTGPLLAQLEAICPPNVHLIGHVENTQLVHIYQQHDVLILPSVAEPWGLVAEEALFYGLPVLLSDKVGCMPQWVLEYQLGTHFSPTHLASLQAAIAWMAQESNFNACKARLSQLNFKQRDHHQVEQYVRAVFEG